jgi:hypothetical protein
VTVYGILNSSEEPKHNAVCLILLQKNRRIKHTALCFGSAELKHTTKQSHQLHRSLIIAPLQLELERQRASDRARERAGEKRRRVVEIEILLSA